jgi:LCP family protein required for cell wall assembly
MEKSGRKIKVLIWVVLILIFGGIIIFVPLSKKREILISNNGQIRITSPTIANATRINFLFLGIGGQENSAPNLTDTIIIINSTLRAENPIAISIPRDLLVKFPEKNFFTKINAVFQYSGIENVKTIINQITGLNLDYYLILDLDTVKDLVDKLGGVDVNVKENIYDPQFPAAYNSFEMFSLKRGLQHLDGETALKYIRSRYQPEGDFSRMQRQQQVISAIKDKILALNFIWNFPTILSIWNTLQKHAITNIGLTDIKYAWNLVKKTSLDEIKFYTISSPLVVSGQEILGGEKAYILKPKAGINDYSEIREYIDQLIK